MNKIIKKTYWAAFILSIVITLAFSKAVFVQTETAYPNLEEGTYIPGHTISTWPSWLLLGKSLGDVLPTDPVNKLGNAGTCETNRNILCLSDSQCGDGKCIFHDPLTGWSDADLSFACSPASYAYRYYVTKEGYSIRVRFEDPGVNIQNLTAFINSFQFFDPSRIFGLTTWKSDTNPYGICEGNEIASLGSGSCGDFIKNIADGEECDPPGFKLVDKSQCTATGGTAIQKVCGTDCRWENPTSVTCASLSVCGNSKVETGEACDDGKKNGTYDKCNTSCTGKVSPFSVNPPGFCGDNYVNETYELCDTTEGLTEPGAMYDSALKLKYATARTDSCSSGCQSYGPYCGDNSVQSQYGEECEIDQTCTFNGRPGVKKCKGCKLGACEELNPIDPAKCGNNLPDPNEACDRGANNGMQCVPSYGQSCSYCSSDCANLIVVPPQQYCGNTTVEAAETCDNGLNNGVPCLAPYDGSCTFCSTDNCQDVILKGPYCGDGQKTSPQEACDKAVDPTDCNAVYGFTCTYCKADCTQGTKNGGSCGDGTKQAPNEDCDKATDPSDCTPAYNSTCNYCKSDCKSGTKVGPKCMDGIIQNPPETCEPNVNLSGSCTAGYNEYCNYCSTGCAVQTKQGPHCGDSVTSTPNGEQCDFGTNNGSGCTANYGSSCSYCTATCQLGTTQGPKCGDGQWQNPPEVCEPGTNLPTSCSAVYGNQCNYCKSDCSVGTTSGGFCGDGVRQTANEVCEPGTNLPVSCTPAYGGQCNYCTVTCSVGTTQGGSCGDGAWQQANEACEPGVNLPAGSCSSTYGQTCNYCSPSCTIATQPMTTYCGDGTIQMAYEVCDGDQACDNNGQYGVKKCSSSCGWSNAGSCEVPVNKGTFTSQIKDVGQTANFVKITWSPTTTPAGTSITMRVRASNSPTMTGAAWIAVNNGGSLSILSGNRYIQYEATLSSNNVNVAPTLNDVTITYNFGGAMAQITDRLILAYEFTIKDSKEISMLDLIVND